jgi:RNase P/RNase MRP subunit POP5
MVERLRKAIDTLRDNGTVKRITEAYLARTAALESKQPPVKP